MKKLVLFLLSAFLGLGVHAQTLKDAQAAIEAEKFDYAKNVLEKLANDNPDDGQYAFHLGTIYLTLGEDALAKQSFERGATAKKNANLNYIGLGRILLDDGRTAEAEAEFDKAMYKMKNKDTDIYLYIAQAYYSSFNPDYAKAAEYARKVVTITPNKAPGYLVLGDAEYKLGNQNEAYMAYRSAYTQDNKLLRGKLNLAIITKDALALPEAVETLNEIIALDPSYGPTYRELAEVYYIWSKVDPSVYDEYIPKALKYYEEYMDLTDYSLDSRMRHADFLVLAKDYDALEKEAAEMQKIDNVNPRILRYLGYSAYENGNYQETIRAINAFLEAIDLRRALGIDYAYLAKAQVKLIEQEGLDPVDEEKLNAMLASLREAIEREAPLDTEFYDLGVALYRARQYGNAAKVFGTLSAQENPRLIDQLYFANSIFYNVANLPEEEVSAYYDDIQRADAAFARVIEASPSTPDPYYNRARLNRILPDAEEKVAEIFRQYIEVVTEKGEAELSKPITRNKLSEAYANLGAFYSEVDKAEAIANFELALEYSPENEHAQQSLNYLKSH